MPETASVSYFVRYEGRAENQAAFLSHYRDHHVPPDSFALLAQMVFATQDDLDRALRSEARAIARDDFGSFPPFHGLVFHQAAVSEEVFSR